MALKKKNCETVIFFDWDDTLQASSELVMKGVTLQTPQMSKEIETSFSDLQNQVISLLKIASEATPNVFIITNAEQGWVQLSSQKFMPRVYSHLNKVKIISARSEYESRFPNTPNMWKQTAFSDNILSIFQIPPPNVNIISFGDSECERLALLSLQKICGKSGKMKSIKFVERPSVSQLRRQLEMVLNNFQFILKHEESLDLLLQISTFVEKQIPPTIKNAEQQINQIPPLEKREKEQNNEKKENESQ